LYQRRAVDSARKKENFGPNEKRAVLLEKRRPRSKREGKEAWGERRKNRTFRGKRITLLGKEKAKGKGASPFRGGNGQRGGLKEKKDASSTSNKTS